MTLFMIVWTMCFPGVCSHADKDCQAISWIRDGEKEWKWEGGSGEIQMTIRWEGDRRMVVRFLWDYDGISHRSNLKGFLLPGNIGNCGWNCLALFVWCWNRLNRLVSVCIGERVEKECFCAHFCVHNLRRHWTITSKSSQTKASYNAAVFSF